MRKARIITPKKVREIRQRASEGETPEQIAKSMKLWVRWVARVVRGSRWQHVR